MKLIGLGILAAATAMAWAAPDDGRDADRAEIRAHIDSIFQAFIHKDAKALRATHDQNWRGFLEGSRTIIRGLEEYMKSTGMDGADPNGPYGMAGYTMRDFDIAFQGDAAFVSFVSEVESKTPTGLHKRTLRICDFYAKRNGHWIQAGSDTEIHPESVPEQYQTARMLPEAQKKSLLEAREAVWRAYFANDRATLEKLVPAEVVTLEPGSSGFGNQKAVLDGAANFAAGGGRLVRIEFPKNEIQVYGYTAIVYSTYELELERGGQKNTRSGHSTEVFVYRNGQWINPGWHLDNSN
jgi:hypothetical protein